MNVTFVIPAPHMSGGMLVILRHARYLIGHGHTVTFIYPRSDLRQRLKRLIKPTAVGSAGEALSLDALDAEHIVVQGPGPLDPAGVPDADVIIATFWTTAHWIAQLPASKGAKVFFVQDWRNPDRGSLEGHDDAWKYPFFKITVSSFLAQIARETFGDEDVALAPNTVDLEQFHAPPRDKQPTLTLGMIYSHKAPIKGSDICFAAADRARELCGDLRLRIFGKVPASKVDLPGYADYICLPSRDEIPRIYASCDAFLWGSRTEGFGLPILEAMACRTPVISTPTGAAPEILAGGGGILVGDEDVEGLAQAVARVNAMTREDWKAMSQHAYDTATKGTWMDSAAASYTWDDVSARFERALQTAIPGR